jgi:DNA-binding transcriptional MerR regulator
MLRLSEAAARLGVSPTTLRSYCERGLVQFREMPNGERRFEEEWLSALHESGSGRAHRQPIELVASADDTTAEQPRRRPRWKERVPPWERQAMAAESAIKVERARQEVARLRVKEAERQLEADRARQTRDAERIEQTRLVDLKQAGKNAIPWYPPELQRQILPELDEWVTSRSVPAFLSPIEQRSLVTSFVQERSAVITAERKRQSERAQRDRAKSELERIESEKAARAQKATFQLAVEDRELEQMEANYQERRALIGLARMLRR